MSFCHRFTEWKPKKSTDLRFVGWFVSFNGVYSLWCSGETQMMNDEAIELIICKFQKVESLGTLLSSKT
jgi:hypothetical protein